MISLNRRQVLVSGVAILAGTGVLELGRAAPAEEASPSGPFLVPSDGGRAGSPWVIRGTTPIRVKVSGKDVGERFSVIEVNTPPGRGPELHVRLHQNEIFYIVAGKIGLQCGSERKVLGVGDTFMAPMHVPHAYVTLGAETARMLNIFDPAKEIEAFFAHYVRLLNQNEPPDEKQMEALSLRCGMKIVGPPLKATAF
jgi:quercetin dioxygenase-like cupin family protein